MHGTLLLRCLSSRPGPHAACYSLRRGDITCYRVRRNTHHLRVCRRSHFWSATSKSMRVVFRAALRAKPRLPRDSAPAKQGPRLRQYRNRRPPARIAKVGLDIPDRTLRPGEPSLQPPGDHTKHRERILRPATCCWTDFSKSSAVLDRRDAELNWAHLGSTSIAKEPRRTRFNNGD